MYFYPELDHWQGEYYFWGNNLVMKKQELLTRLEVFDRDEALAQADQELVEQAREASLRSYAPYSDFSVGAAVRLSDGSIVQGNNQENAAYPSGLCAERVALFYVQSRFPDLIPTAIAIAVRRGNEWLSDPVPPCGACLQVLTGVQERYGQAMRVILSGSKKTTIIPDGRELLPLRFDASQLGK